MRVYAYCLMSNHVHLIVRDTSKELSNAMKQLNSRYAMYYKFSSIHAYKRDKGNFLNIVDTKPVLKLIDKDTFLKWNDEMCYEKFMDVVANKLSDLEVINEMVKITKTKKINEFRNLDEPTKMLAVLKKIDKGVSMMQLSRITGIYYSKIQKLKKGQEGKVIGLTYYK